MVCVYGGGRVCMGLQELELIHEHTNDIMCEGERGRKRRRGKREKKEGEGGSTIHHVIPCCVHQQI